jgi:transcriptional regulator with XRE-family HTH domain
MKTRLTLNNNSLQILENLGDNIKLARLRRKLSTEIVAERAHITRVTLFKVENGLPSVSIGSLYKVLKVLGLDKDLLKVAKDDELGRKIQDADIMIGKRSSKRN